MGENRQTKKLFPYPIGIGITNVNYIPSFFYVPDHVAGARYRGEQDGCSPFKKRLY